MNNLFNAEYESNGYGYSYMDTWSGPAPVRIDEAYYFPQAPLNVLANVTGEILKRAISTSLKPNFSSEN